MKCFNQIRFQKKCCNARKSVDNICTWQKAAFDRVYDPCNPPDLLCRPCQVLAPIFSKHLLECAQADHNKKLGGANTVGTALEEEDFAPFVPNADFKLVLLTSQPVHENNPLFPFVQSGHLSLFKLTDKQQSDPAAYQKQRDNEVAASGLDDASLDAFRSFASSFRDLRRPSEDLVEAAFDGDLETVQLEVWA